MAFYAWLRKGAEDISAPHFFWLSVAKAQAVWILAARCLAGGPDLGRPREYWKPSTSGLRSPSSQVADVTLGRRTAENLSRRAPKKGPQGPIP